MTRTVGPYELLKRIAVGGAAEIYLARKGGLLGFEQHYALKVLLPHREDDEEHRKMMVDEARLTAQLDHPNIIKVHDLGEDGSTLFMVMEYVNGLNLAQLIMRLQKLDRKMPIEVAVYIAREMCGGLHYAHTRKSADGSLLQLVHRDVSPQNLLVGHGGEVKLIDFGVAKATMRGRIETKTGIIKGKLTYMAPEYAVGSQQDHRSDIFAVALVLYEMLTGRAAYDIDDARELVESVKTAKIQRPSKFREGVPPGLEKLLERALEEDPNDRYQSAEELQHALTQFLSVYAPEFRKEQLGAWMTEVREAATAAKGADEADTNPELPDIDDVIAEASATADPDDGLEEVEPTTGKHTAFGLPAVADDDEEIDMDSLVATQSHDLEASGLRPRKDPPNRKTSVGMSLSEERDEAGQSGPQKRADLLAGLGRPTEEAVLTRPDDGPDTDVLSAEQADDAASTGDTEVLPASIEIPPLATDEPDVAMTEKSDVIKIQRDFAASDSDLALAPTADIDLADIHPSGAIPGSELPTAMNLEVDRIRGDIVPRRTATADQPEILTQSGFQAFAQRPDDPNAVTGKSTQQQMLSGTGTTRPEKSVERLPAPVVLNEGSPHEGLPAVGLSAEASEPLPPLEKRTPGLMPPEPDPDREEVRLSDSATALIGKLNERYDEFSKTESGRKATDAIIVAVLGLTLFLVIMYIFFFAN